VGRNGRSHYQPAPASEVSHAGMTGGPIA
jgi:hypothetical protein